MLNWLHEKLYPSAMIKDFHDLTGINIENLSRAVVGEMETNRLFKKAYKRFPKSPIEGANFILQSLKNEGLFEECFAIALENSDKKSFFTSQE